MKRRLTITAVLILVLMTQGIFVAGLTRTTCAAAPPIYMVIDMGTLGGSMSYAQAINNSGQITGASSLTGDPTDSLGNPIFHTFLYRNRQMIDLGTLGGDTSVGNALDEAGYVAGASFLSGNPMAYGSFAHHAFRYDGNIKTDLGSLGGVFGSSATGINDSGQVVGQADIPDGRLRGFFYGNSGMQEIPTPASDYTVAYAINNSGLIVGTIIPHGSTTQRAFSYDSQGVAHQFTDLGTLGGNFAQAISVDDSGLMIVGESSLPGPPDSESLHAFLYVVAEGRMKDLGTLPGDTYSSASHINALGQVVGWSVPADFGMYRGFLWSNGVMQDLNTLIPADSGWQISFASGINDLGQIVGVGIRNGQSHAVLLISPAFSIGILKDLVQSFNFPHGIENSLIAKLQNAIASANAGDFASACNQLQAFVNQVIAQSGNQIPVQQANQLLTVANQLRASFGCQ